MKTTLSEKPMAKMHRADVHRDKRPFITSPAFFIGKYDSQLVSFGSGQPDLPPPKHLFDVGVIADDFRYSSIQGNCELRAKLASKHDGFSADSFLITNGASEAFDLVLRVLAQKHRQQNPAKKAKVLLPRPYYYSYSEIASLCGLECVFYPLVEGRVEIDVFRERVAGCVAAVVNSPSNPLGSIQSHKLISQMEKECEKAGVVMISDEVYDELDDSTTAIAYASETTVAINSFSKTFSLCGIRVGYAYTKNLELISAMIEAKTHSSMNTSNFSQRLAAMSLDTATDFLTDQHHIWRQRRQHIYESLCNMGLQPVLPEGAFYIFVKMRHASQAVQDLYYDYKVIVYDGKWFGTPEHLRMSYALSKEQMEKGLERLHAYCRSIGL